MWSNLQPYGGLISVCGALVIFISWIVNNAVQERFKDAATSLVESRNRTNVYARLQEISNSVASLHGVGANLSGDLAEVLQVLRAPDDKDGRHRAWFERQRLSMELAGHRVNALQIDNAAEFCANELSACGSEKFGHARELELTYETVEKLRGKKDKMFAAADRAFRSGEDPQVHLDGLREVIDEFAAVAPKAVDSANALNAEESARVERLRREAKWAKRASLTMYAIGSLLAVAGTALDKL